MYCLPSHYVFAVDMSVTVRLLPNRPGSDVVTDTFEEIVSDLRSLFIFGHTWTVADSST